MRIDEAGERAGPLTLAGAMLQRAVADRPVSKAPPPAVPAAARPLQERGAAAFALHPPRTGHGLDPRHQGRFAERIEAFRRHHAALPAPRLTGGLQLLDIEELRLRFCNRWPAVREKAYQIVEGCLAKRLGAHDLYVAVEGDRFHLLTTDVDRLAAERRGRFIAAEITERLCGMVPGGVACKLQTTGFDLVQGLAGVTGLAELEARISNFRRQVDDAEQALFAAHEPELEALFQPILHVRKRLVAGYALTPMLDGEAGRQGVAELCPVSLNGVFDAAVDRWSIGQVAPHLHAARAALRLTLHYSTLATMRHREQLILACRRLPAGAGRRPIIEIAGLPASLPQARVRELVSYLRPFAVAIVVRIEPDLLAAAGSGDRTPGRLSMITDNLQASGVAGISALLRSSGTGSGDDDDSDAEGRAATDGEAGDAATLLTGLAALGRAAGLRTCALLESGAGPVPVRCAPPSPPASTTSRARRSCRPRCCRVG
ncbi:MAG: hypothetical protein R3D25_15030 [Geminicoccaceae bacterium]